MFIILFYREIQRGKNGLYVVARNFCLALPGSCLAKHANIFSPLYRYLILLSLQYMVESLLHH